MKILQQNWNNYRKKSLDFLDQLDKEQAIILLKKVIISHNTNSDCYYCLEYAEEYHKKRRICYDCVIMKNFIDIGCKYVKKLNLKKHLIGLDSSACYKCVNCTGIVSANSFSQQFENQQWYHHCFGHGKRFFHIDPVEFIFNISNDLHYYLFMQQTRFNHHNYFRGLETHQKCDIRHHVYYYDINYESESSVEEVMSIIDTARLIFRQFHVPKCIRNLLIEWYLI